VQGGATRSTGDARVLFHDMTEDRPEYRPVFKYFEVVESANSLYYLKIKRNLDMPELLCDFLQFQYDPR
jgi:hypothetical protein